MLTNQFFGGRCERLCPGKPSTCPSTHTPVRFNTTTAADGTSCFATACFTPDQALRKLARGAYSLWRKGRLDTTGIYSDSTDPSAPSSAQSDMAHIGINGVGLIFECVAVGKQRCNSNPSSVHLSPGEGGMRVRKHLINTVSRNSTLLVTMLTYMLTCAYLLPFVCYKAEMGWITPVEAATRVNLSLTALAGELPGFKLARQAADGWIPTFFNRTSGAALGRNQPYTVLDSGE